MRKRVLSLPAALLAFSCFLPASSARADSYTFTIGSIDSPALSGSGTLTTIADPTRTGVQDVVSLTGTISNGTLTGNNNPVSISLIPIQPSQAMNGYSEVNFDTGIDPTSGQDAVFHLTYDNYLFGGNALDGYGLGFVSADGVSYELAALNGGYAYEAFTNSESFDQRTLNGPAVNLAISPAAAAVTPEPSSIALLGTGLLGAFGVLRRRVQA